MFKAARKGYPLAKVIANGFTDTAIAGAPAMTVAVGKLNFAADWRVLSDQPGEAILINRTSPFDQQESIRFSQREVKDVYAGSDIDPAARATTKSGKSTYIELKGVWSETDTVDATYQRLLPYKVGITLNVPTNSSVTADMALAQFLRAMGSVFETGTVTSAGINNLLRGVLKKADL